jgi:UPF0271 protein
MNADELEYMTAYQIGALQAIARYADLPVTHLKAHGALANMAAVDKDYAGAPARAIKVVDPGIIYVALAGSEMEKAADRLGLRVAREGYADRQYDDDGNLASRSLPGTVHREPAKALEQALRLIETGEVVTRSGKVIKVEIDTICVHGDEPSAVTVAKAIRTGLDREGIEVVTLPEIMAGR